MNINKNNYKIKLKIKWILSRMSKKSSYKLKEYSSYLKKKKKHVY